MDRYLSIFLLQIEAIVYLKLSNTHSLVWLSKVCTEGHDTHHLRQLISFLFQTIQKNYVRNQIISKNICTFTG